MSKQLIKNFGKWIKRLSEATCIDYKRLRNIAYWNAKPTLSEDTKIINVILTSAMTSIEDVNSFNSLQPK